MGLEQIHIKNYKCIRDYKISLKQVTLLLGENGSGKTNILSAISYVYANMISQEPSQKIFDENNPLNDQAEITLTYDLSRLLIRSRKNRKEKKDKYQSYYNRIEERKILYHMYPLYLFDAREINLVNWEELWKDIGDLIKPSSGEIDAIQKGMTKAAAASMIKREKRMSTRRRDSLI